LIGSEPPAQPESPAAQTIAQSARSEDILDLSRISLGPGIGNGLPQVIGNIRLREHELKSLLAPVKRICRSPLTRPRAHSMRRTLRTSLERTSFSNAPGPPTKQRRF
jgi:hypothetical protein